MFKQVFVAAVKLTAAACADEKQEPSEKRYRRVCTSATGGLSLGCTRRAALLFCLRAFLCMLAVTKLLNSFSVSRHCVQISQKNLECQLPIICLWIILLESNPGNGAIHVKYAG